MTDYKKQGKANRAAGARFELKVRKDLESKDWIVSKWMNNVEFPTALEVPLISFNPSKSNGDIEYIEKRFSMGKLIPAKHKFRGPGIPMAIGTGFPDFVAFKLGEWNIINKTKHKLSMNEIDVKSTGVYVIMGVEVKSNGYLTKIEKEKCDWLLKNNIFQCILITSKGEARGQIVYKEYE